MEKPLTSETILLFLFWDIKGLLVEMLNTKIINRNMLYNSYGKRRWRT